MLRVDICASCGQLGNVIDSRHSTGISSRLPGINDLPYRRKRYACAHCDYRWSTFELREDDLSAKLNPPKPKQISSLGLAPEQQAVLVARLQAKAPREIKPARDENVLWCGYPVAEQQVDQNGVEWCSSCSRESRHR